MKRYLFLLVISTLAVVLAACGSSEPEAPEPVSFRIEMTEYAFTPNEIDVSVGQEVILTLINKGQLQHEIMIGRDMEMANGRPNGYAVDLFEFAGVEPEVQGGMLMIDGKMVMGDEHDAEMDMQEGEHDDDMAGMEDEMNEMEMASDEHEEGEEMHMAEDDHGHDGLMVMLPKTDDRATMKFVVTEEMVGTWEIGCFELDGVHYDAGMTGTLTVTDS